MISKPLYMKPGRELVNFFLLVFIGLPVLSVAQNQQPAEIQKVQIVELGKLYYSPEDYIAEEYVSLGLDSPDDLIKSRTFDLESAGKHTRYEQRYRGLPVLGASWSLHEKEGVVKRATGVLYRDIECSTQATLDRSIAKALSENFLLTEHLKSTDQDPQKPTLALATMESSHLVVLDRQFPKSSGEYALAYECTVSLNSMIPVRERIFIDAHTGEVITHLSTVSHTSVEGVANTRYYGEVNIVADSIAQNRYRLYDAERNVHTVDDSDAQGFMDSHSLDFYDEDNYWDNRNPYMDEIAGDAHYCASAMHDFMLDEYNWKGVDGDSMEYKTYVHLDGGSAIVNAFWTGLASYYGDGNCEGYGPLTTLEVVGHEFAHGFTQFTSGLLYFDEHGGINEATSDIFGKALEYKYDPEGFDWYLGESFLEDSSLDPFRSMEDPNLFGNPKYYEGRFWDNSGVHSWSGLWNHWFYLLVEGGEGVNEVGEPYDVESIGMKKALDLVFLLHTAYLTNTSSYQETYELSQLAVTDLYGSGSPEMRSMNEAYKVIGLSVGHTGGAPISDLAISLYLDSIPACSDDSLTISVEVENLGADTIATSEVLLLRYISNFTIVSQEYQLNTDLLPGETVLITFNQKFKPQSNIFHLVVDLDYNDDNLSNNTSFENLYVEMGGEMNNLRLNAQFFNQGLSCDGESDNVLWISVFNSSCEVLEAGTMLPVTVEVNGEEEMMPFQILTDTETGRSFGSAFDLDAGLFNEGLNEWSVEMDYEDDDLTDNRVSGTRVKWKSWQEESIEDFSQLESIDELEDLRVTDGLYTSVDIVEHLGEKMLAVSTNNINDDKGDCEELSRFYATNNTNKTSLEICVDGADIERPILEVEAVFYRETEYIMEPFEYSSIMGIEIPKSHGRLSELHYGYPEGELVEIAYELPAYYSGPVKLNALVWNGAFQEFDENIGDHILINKIYLRNGFVPAEVDIQQDIPFFPNPAENHVVLQLLDDQLYDIEVYNSLGQRVDFLSTVSGAVQWHNSEGYQGVHFFRIVDSDQNTVTLKVILQ